MPIQVTNGQPVSYNDFAQLYAGNPGMTPDQVQTDLFLHAPSAGTDYLSKQWSGMGFQESPEKHFARPEVVAALQASRSPASGQASTPSVQASIPSAYMTDAGPTPPSPMATSWPSFRDDDERRIALGLGHFDPQFVNPRAKTIYELLSGIRQKEQEASQAYQVKMFGGVTPKFDTSHTDDSGSGMYPNGQPIPVDDQLSNRSALLRSQLAGDATGTVAKILRDRAGQDPRIAGVPMVPYVSSKLGSSLDYVGQNSLDREIYDHPEFQKLLRENPHQASFVYERLTNRPLLGESKVIGDDGKSETVATGDLSRALVSQSHAAKFATSLQETAAREKLNMAMGFQKDAVQRQIDEQLLPTKVGREFVQHNTDAVYDPMTKKWKVWGTADAPFDPNNPSGASITGQAPKPYRQLRPASDAESGFLQRHYQEVTGMPIPVAPTLSKTQQVEMHNWKNNPRFTPAIEQKEQQLGHSLTYRDMDDLINRKEIERMNSELEIARHGALSYVQQAGNALFGKRGVNPRTGMPISPSVFPSLNDVPRDYIMHNPDGSLGDVNSKYLNWWGQFMQHPADSTGKFLGAASDTMQAGLYHLTH